MSEKNPVRYLSDGVFYCLIILLFSSTTASSEPVSPFYTHDQNPLVLIYGLPTPVSADLLAGGESRLITSLNISNTINVETTPTESLFVDAETYQLNLFYDYGLSNQWMLRFQLPLISHRSGFLDSWIDSYHDLLDLSEGQRPPAHQ